MEKHPEYNGNLQIILRNQDLTTRIDMKAVNNFYNYFTDFTDNHRYYNVHGKRFSIEERNGRINELYEEMSGMRYGFPDKVTYEIRRGNLRDEYRTLRRARMEIDPEYDFAEEMIYLVRQELSQGKITVDSESYLEFKGIVDRYGIKFRFSEGIKFSRLVGKLAKLIGLDKHSDIRDASFYDQSGTFHERTKDYGWNAKFANFCDSINPTTVKGTVVISVNPIDFWTMSFGYKWTSCHTIDKMNIRRCDSGHNYRGMYCGGTESYMLDNSSVIVYTLPYDFACNAAEFADKIKRCMFHLGEDKMVQGRVYPDGRDGGDATLAPDIRAIMQKTVADLLGVPNLWKLERGTYVCDEVTVSEGPHYRDYLEYDDCNVSFLRRIDGYINRNYFTIGSETIICPECGDRHYTEDNIYCEDCTTARCRCAQCGDVIDRDEVFYVYDTPYCSDCINVCDNCDAAYVRELDGSYRSGGEYLNHYDRCVCTYCLRQGYVWSDEEEDYVDRDEAVRTEEGSVWFEDSEEWAICKVCGEAHDRSEMVEVDGNWYCQSCAPDND